MSTLQDMSGRHRKREIKNKLFLGLCITITALTVCLLGILLVTLVVQGWKHLDFDFLTHYASRKPEKAGIKASLWGSVLVCAVCTFSALPIGIGTAIYLEEFAARNRLLGFIRLNISNLAGVPSIVYGILGMTAFVSIFGIMGTPTEPIFEFGTLDDWYYFRLPFGRSVLAGGLTLMLVVLPVVIVSALEALRAVPNSLREAALAMGATRWQMVSKITLPVAFPGMLTGSILAISRAMGEAAPILVIAGIVFIRFTPAHLLDEFTVMPLQIYNWAGRPQAAFHDVAATGILVLLAVLLSFNAIAVFLRQILRKPLS